MTVLVKAHAGFYGRVRVLSDLTYCWPFTGAASQVKKMYIYIYIYIYIEARKVLVKIQQTFYHITWRKTTFDTPHLKRKTFCFEPESSQRLPG